MKERGSLQDERDPCLLINVVRGICVSVYVDVLAVGPKDATRQLQQDLAKDASVYGAEIPQESLGRSLSKTARRGLPHKDHDASSCTSGSSGICAVS